MEKSAPTVVEVTPERDAAAIESVRNITSRKWDDPGDAAFAQAEISLEILRVLQGIESQLQILVEHAQSATSNV